MSTTCASTGAPATAATPPQRPRVNVMMVGDAGCGKSTFFSRLSLGQQRGQPVKPTTLNLPNGKTIILTPGTVELPPVIPDGATTPETVPPLPELKDSDQPFIYNVRLGYRRFQLAFYDTSYQEEHFSQMNPNVVILAYDVTSRAGLGGLREWRSYITRAYQAPGMSADVFASNDPERGRGTDEDREKVQVMLLGLKRDLRREGPGIIYPQEAYRMAQEMHCDAYAECSAATGELVPQVFEDIVRLAVLSRTGKRNEQGPCVIL